MRQNRATDELRSGNRHREKQQSSMMPFPLDATHYHDFFAIICNPLLHDLGSWLGVEGGCWCCWSHPSIVLCCCCCCQRRRSCQVGLIRSKYKLGGWFETTLNVY